MLQLAKYKNAIVQLLQCLQMLQLQRNNEIHTLANTITMPNHFLVLILASVHSHDRSYACMPRAQVIKLLVDNGVCSYAVELVHKY